MSEPLETAPHRAMRLIRARISDGTFPPMSRLPRETELATELGVSRAALREAIRAMELLGILESRHGSGTYVTSLRLSALLPSLAHSGFLLHADSVPDLVEIRLVVEPAFSARAAATRPRPTGADPVGVRTHGADHRSGRVRAAGRRVPSVDRAVGRQRGDGQRHGGAHLRRRLAAHVGRGDQVSHPGPDRYEHEQLVIAIETGDPDPAFSVAYSHIAAVNGRLRDLAEQHRFEHRSNP